MYHPNISIILPVSRSFSLFYFLVVVNVIAFESILVSTLASPVFTSIHEHDLESVIMAADYTFLCCPYANHVMSRAPD